MVAFSVLPLVRVLVTGGCLADGLVAPETAASQMDKCSVLRWWLLSQALFHCYAGALVRWPHSYARCFGAKHDDLFTLLQSHAYGMYIAPMRLVLIHQW